MGSGGERVISGVQERPIDVIVVDDDGDARELIATFLSDNLCVVRSASSAKQARDAIAERVPDVLVSDLDLGPGLTGWLLADEVRRDASATHVARIAVTGAVEPHMEVVRAFDAYLRKPIDLKLLLDLVRRLSEISRAEQRTPAVSAPSLRRRRAQ